MLQPVNSQRQFGTVLHSNNVSRPIPTQSVSRPSIELVKPVARFDVAQRQLTSDTISPPNQQDRYAAVVVGAGPAGITVVGNLLEQNIGHILWVDDSFTAGRVNHAYREVPSNTKSKLFIDFAEAVAPFREIIEDTPAPHAVDELRKLNQDKGCRLAAAADMLLMLTNGLIKHERITAVTGRVSSASLDKARRWAVSLSENSKAVDADRLVLCTGSSPIEADLPVKVANIKSFSLDTALCPSVLAEKIPSERPCTIAVIGASHSAILVLRNLAELASTSHPHLRITWFTRHALRYAEYMQGWILRDNTGLKGEAADWARENLEPDVFDKSSVQKFIKPIKYNKADEEKVLKEHLDGCDYYIQAIGYKQNPLPTIYDENKAIVPCYNNLDGSFSLSEKGSKTGEKLSGLYGAGIAWPEQVTDPHGNVEYAVGFWKFMKFIKRASPQWT